MNLKTSDIAICAETSQSTIRELSDQGLLGPVARAKNSHYRAFDPRQIPQVYLIKTLRELGVTTQQLKDFSKNRSPDGAVELFSSYSEQLYEEIAQLQAQLDMLESYTALIEEGQSVQPGEIKVRKYEQRLIRTSSLTRLGGKRNDLACLRFAHAKIRQNGNAGCPMGFVYNEFFDLLEDPDSPAKLVSFDPSGPELRPAGEYLVGTVRCRYDEKNGLPQRMFNYALHNGYEFCGPAYTVYLLDAASVCDAEQFLLQVAVQVQRNEGN